MPASGGEGKKNAGKTKMSVERCAESYEIFLTNLWEKKGEKKRDSLTSSLFGGRGEDGRKEKGGALRGGGRERSLPYPNRWIKKKRGEGGRDQNDRSGTDFMKKGRKTFSCRSHHATVAKTERRGLRLRRVEKPRKKQLGMVSCS